MPVGQHLELRRRTYAFVSWVVTFMGLNFHVRYVSDLMDDKLEVLEVYEQKVDFGVLIGIFFCLGCVHRGTRDLAVYLQMTELQPYSFTSLPTS